MSITDEVNSLDRRVRLAVGVADLVIGFGNEQAKARLKARLQRLADDLFDTYCASSNIGFDMTDNDDRLYQMNEQVKNLQARLPA